MAVTPSRFPLFLMSGLMLAMVSGLPARAADMAEPMPMADEPLRPALTELGTGWYLRGDISYRVNDNPTANYAGIVPFSGEKIDNNIAIGGGIGYKLTNWFRADLTADYGFDGKFSGSSACLLNCGDPSISAHAKILPTTFLLNGYFDLGNWSGFTPYVGAGVGASYVRTESYGFYNANGLYNTSGLGLAQPGYGIANAWKLSFAYALMAGVSFQLSPNLLVDAGYRYLSIGEGRTSPDPVGNRVTFKDLKAQEVRLGLRYMIDGM
jgi:opacity protein-like surface antigen